MSSLSCFTSSVFCPPVKPLNNNQGKHKHMWNADADTWPFKRSRDDVSPLPFLPWRAMQGQLPQSLPETWGEHKPSTTTHGTMQGCCQQGTVQLWEQTEHRLASPQNAVRPKESNWAITSQPSEGQARANKSQEVWNRSNHTEETLTSFSPSVVNTHLC